MENSLQIKNNIHELYNLLSKRTDPSPELLDIIDVLLQVHLKIDTSNNPPALLNRLVNYIRALSLKGRIHYSAEEENLLIQLGLSSQQAGLNGLYKANFSDKSQFYTWSEKIPRHS